MADELATKTIDTMVERVLEVRAMANATGLRTIATFAEVMIRYMAAERDVWAQHEDPDAKFYGIAQALQGTVFEANPTVAAEVKRLVGEA